MLEPTFGYRLEMDSPRRWPTPLYYVVVVALVVVSVALIAASAFENNLGYLSWLTSVALVGFIWFGTVGNPKRSGQ